MKNDAANSNVGRGRGRGRGRRAGRIGGSPKKVTNAPQGPKTLKRSEKSSPASFIRRIKNRDDRIPIVDDDFITERPKKVVKRKKSQPKESEMTEVDDVWFFGIVKCEVYQQMNEDDQEKLNRYCTLTGPDSSKDKWAFIWQLDEFHAIGREELHMIMHKEELSGDTIDVFLQVLSRCPEYRKVALMQSSAQEQTYEELGQYTNLYCPLLKSLGHCDKFFFIVRTNSKRHFTLLVLDIHQRKWMYLNPLRRDDEPDDCLEISKQFILIIENVLLEIKNEAQMCMSSKKRKHLEHNWKEERIDRSEVDLTDAEFQSMKCIQFGHFDSFKFPVEEDRLCVQQPSMSVDCGVVCIKYIQLIVNGEDTRQENFKDFRLDMLKSRAGMVSRFMNDPPYSWNEDTWAANLLAKSMKFIE